MQRLKKCRSVRFKSSNLSEEKKKLVWCTCLKAQSAIAKGDEGKHEIHATQYGLPQINRKVVRNSTNRNQGIKSILFDVALPYDHGECGRIPLDSTIHTRVSQSNESSVNPHLSTDNSNGWHSERTMGPMHNTNDRKRALARLIWWQLQRTDELTRLQKYYKRGWEN